MANGSEAKVDYNVFKVAVTKSLEPTTTIQWNGLDINIKKNLSLAEAISFVESVVASAFGADGTFLPERIDAAILICVVGFYTNIELGDDIEEMYELINSSAITDMVLEKINQRQFDKIISAIYKKIDIMVSLNIHDVTEQMNEMRTAFENIGTSMSALFDGIKPEDMNGVINALSSGVIDEKKLVEAIAENNNQQ